MLHLEKLFYKHGRTIFVVELSASPGIKPGSARQESENKQFCRGDDDKNGGAYSFLVKIDQQLWNHFFFPFNALPHRI